MTLTSLEPRLRTSHIWPRSDSDWYTEPSWCSARLFEAEVFAGAIHDPAVGTGRVVEAALAHGFEATGADIVDRGFSFPVRDFALTTTPVDNIVTNPPFALAQRFIEHGLALARRNVAVIFPTARLNAARWLADTPLQRIWLLTPRPSMPPGETILRGEKAAGGKTDFCWLVFEQGYEGEPSVAWLRRDAP
jgi:hypothetical protein